MLGTMVYATLLVLSVLVIPSISLADYGGGGGGGSKTTTKVQSSSTDTTSTMAAPEFDGSIDWILFLALAALVLLITRSHKKG
jgi:hypothetical protein